MQVGGNLFGCVWTSVRTLQAFAERGSSPELADSLDGRSFLPGYTGSAPIIICRRKSK